MRLIKDIIDVYCDNHKKHTNKLRGQNAEFRNVTSDGLHSHHLIFFCDKQPKLGLSRLSAEVARSYTDTRACPAGLV